MLQVIQLGCGHVFHAPWQLQLAVRPLKVCLQFLDSETNVSGESD